MPCLTPSAKEKLRTLLSTEGTKLSDLAKMGTVKSKAILVDAMGKETGEWINYEIEKRKIMKTTESLKNFIKGEALGNKQKSDVLKRISKFADALNDPEKMKMVGTVGARNQLIEDVIAHKIGVAVTEEEAGIIMDLAKKAQSGREELAKTFKSNKKYAIAFTEIQKGTKKADALEKAGISQEQYDSVTEERAKHGANIYEYSQYMDALKQESYKLKASDWSENWYEASKKLVTQIIDTIPRYIQASGDMGAPTRQGQKAGYYDPRIWHKNNMELFNNAKNAISKNLDFKSIVMAELLSRPNAIEGIYEKSGLAVQTLEDYYSNSLVEPLFDGKEGQKKNIFQEAGQRYNKFSQDTYLTYLYKLRADLFDAHVDTLEKAGAEYKEIGEFINNLTGRGEGAVAEKGRGIMFAARYTQSQINSIGKIFDTQISAPIRKAYIKNLASQSAGILTLVLLSTLFGGKPEEDMTSSNWGRIKLPNGYVFDVSGGVTSWVVLLARAVFQHKKTQKGKIRKLGDYGVERWDQLLWQQMVNKGSPAVSTVMSIFNRSLYGGKDLTFANFLWQQIPIVGQDITEKWSDEDLGVADKFLYSILSELGISGYNPEHFDKERRTK